MKPLIIIFTGIDGSGKTTISKALVNRLKSSNIETDYLWWFEAENSLFRRFLRMVSGKKLKKQSKDTNRKLPESSFITTLYQCMVLLDYQRQTLFHVWMRSILGKTIVCDRYIYDIVISFAMEFGYTREQAKGMLLFLSRISPKPDITFYVDVPVEIAIVRKKDMISIEHHNELRKWYLDIVAKDMRMLDGTKSIDELNAIIWKQVSEIIKKEGHI